MEDALKKTMDFLTDDGSPILNEYKYEMGNVYVYRKLISYLKSHPNHPDVTWYEKRLEEHVIALEKARQDFQKQIDSLRHKNWGPAEWDGLFIQRIMPTIEKVVQQPYDELIAKIEARGNSGSIFLFSFESLDGHEEVTLLHNRTNGFRGPGVAGTYTELGPQHRQHKVRGKTPCTSQKNTTQKAQAVDVPVHAFLYFDSPANELNLAKYDPREVKRVTVDSDGNYTLTHLNGHVITVTKM